MQLSFKNILLEKRSVKNFNVFLRDVEMLIINTGYYVIRI